VTTSDRATRPAGTPPASTRPPDSGASADTAPARPPSPTRADASSPITPDELPHVLERAAAGDPHAWRRLLHAYGRRVIAMARAHLNDPDAAEEIAQSVFVTLAEKLPASDGYAERGRFEAWLFRITMNRVRDEARRRKRRARPTDPLRFAEAERRGAFATGRPRADPSLASAGERQTPDLAELARLRDALEQLPDDDRAIVAMRHHGQMSFKQIAQALGCPLGTALARHHRALAKLRQLLPPVPPPPP